MMQCCVHAPSPYEEYDHHVLQTYAHEGDQEEEEVEGEKEFKKEFRIEFPIMKVIIMYYKYVSTKN